MYLYVNGKPRNVDVALPQVRARRLRWWERMLERLLPSRRKQRERRLLAAMRWLVAHPDWPVRFDE
jgi:hypothetical protein